ncbi:MAG: glycosyltransferase family 2 protein [Deltaproteobacteria bacterium]|nr:glycosyltransferase family 2 protein [Deltaproteobacteria bacterium]
MAALSASIVIPLYNKARYIERTVRSVLEQSCPDFELIVVDDGSQDGGDALVEQIKDRRLRLVRRARNGGQNATRNTGIKEARGPLIAFLDGDDEWDPEHLEALVTMAGKFPQAGLLATGYRIIFPRNLIMEMTIPSKKPGESQYLLTDYFRRARAGTFVWISALAIRRAVFEEVGLFLEDEHIGGDLEMSGRVALRYPLGYDCRLLATYHAEAQGRQNPRRDRKVQTPPFARTFKQALEKGVVSYPVPEDVREYVHYLWLLYLWLVLSHGDRLELQRVLEGELAQTRVFRNPVRLLKLMSALLPLGVIHFFWKFGHSRYWPWLDRGPGRNDILYRKAGRSR